VNSPAGDTYSTGDSTEHTRSPSWRNPGVPKPASGCAVAPCNVGCRLTAHDWTAAMATERVFGGQPFRRIPRTLAGMLLKGVVGWDFGCPPSARRAAGEGEPVGVAKQSFDPGIAECVVTDHVVPVFNRPTVGHSAWRTSRSVAPIAPMSVMTTRIP
jgi:hypothetical protein